MPLTHDSITAALFMHWRDHFALPIPTIYPGTAVDTSAISEWFELWTDTWPRRPQRATARQLIDLVLTLHIFTKPASAPARIRQLADAARAVISQQRIPIRDGDLSSGPPAGYVSLFESETRDFSRSHRDAHHHNLRHIVLTIPGLAESL